MKKINVDARVIAKCKNYYIIVNEASAYSELTEGIIIDSNGVHITSWLPIGVLLREQSDWELIDLPYVSIFKENKIGALDGLLGLAVGDALGVPVEFMSREEVRNVHVTDMIGNDTNSNIKSRWGDVIPSGSWSDDTSMVIAGMDSLADNNCKANYSDIMKRYNDWWFFGKYCSLDRPFGLGGCVAKSFENYHNGIAPLECGTKRFEENGNGSLMRMFPFSYYCIINNLSEKETCDYISKASMLTHAHPISCLSCFIYTEFLRAVMETKNPRLAYFHINGIDYSKYFDRETILSHKQLLNPKFLRIDESEIKSTGYVVDTLESVIYSILNTDNYSDAVLKAINMGYDTDTVAGITGSVAGMLYGVNNIPDKWLNSLRKKKDLERVGEKFEMSIEQNLISKKKDELVNKGYQM